MEGDALVARCHSVGSLPIKYSILHDNVVISSSDFMFLSNISQTNDGVYSCEAENESGSKKSKGILIKVACKFS